MLLDIIILLFSSLKSLLTFRHPYIYNKLPHSAITILEKNCKFYNKLDKKEQKLFKHRVVSFISHHDFKGNKGLQITQEMQLLIAGTAVKLSFGFKDYLFSLFDTILIYPSSYYSNFSHTKNKGETNPKYGVVVFSWEDFKAGIAIENDNLHLGIHEFTHALHFSFMHKDSREGNVFLHNFNKLLSYLENTEVQKKLINSGYIRKYAFSNQYEFLAVLVEHLFETPEKLKKEFPVIYKLVIDLLKIENRGQF